MFKKYLIFLDCIYISIFIIIAIFMLSINVNLNDTNKKLDEIIKLNTPEIIHIIPDQII